MTMDGLTLYASMLEIRALVGGRIDKIQQPERDEIIIGVYADSENKKLLLSASAEQARAQLTEAKRVSPIDAPMFCMLLRKRLTGGRIISVDQPNFDRIIRIVIEARNDMGDTVPYSIYAEIMGKRSNIVFVDENGVVIDAVRRISLGMSNVRCVLPGLKYELPPSQDKRDPLGASEEDFFESLSGEGRIDKTLSGRWFGLSPAMAAALTATVSEARELSALDDAERRIIANGLYRFYCALGRGEFSPTLVINEYGEPIAAYPFVPSGYATKPAVSMGAALDACFDSTDIRERMHRRSATVRRILQNNIERCNKKLGLYDDALTSDETIAHARHMGELITANLNRIKPGMTKVKVTDYYLDPPSDVEIELDPAYSPGDNAQRWYKKYQKMRSARDMATEQRARTLEELDYLEGQMDNLDKCTADNELAELTEELRDQGYMRRETRKTQPSRSKVAASKPMHFISSDGIDILVGKNNKQNDTLTLKIADGSDIWLHTKNIPGSHVIIRSGGEPPKQTLFEGAMLAAYYSHAGGGASVDVDYTERKNVKKPAGAVPGMVIYSTNRTASISPDEAVIKNLKRVE